MRPPHKVSVFDVAAELQMAAKVHGGGGAWEKMAYNSLAQLDPNERNEVPGIMVGLHGIHTMEGGREFLFKLCQSCGVSSGQMCGQMASMAFIWINHSKNLGWEILDWLIEHQQLLVRSDIQGMEMEEGHDLPGFLVELWNTHTIMNEGGDEVWTRQWAGDVIARVPNHPARVNDMLRDLAVAHHPSFSTGLLLACLDLGADWKTLANDASVTPDTWSVIAQHPSWKRDELNSAVHQEAGRAEDRPRM